MTDGYGRKIEYLRMSVTDACNLKCVYCMPPDGMKECPCRQAMSADEFVEIARAAAAGDPFEIAFVDWQMPELDGIATAGRIRQLALD